MYICQVCGKDLDSEKHPPQWRPDLTGHKRAGNICPSCFVKKTKKPKMPEKRPTVNIGGIRATLMMDLSKYSNGHLAMTIQDVGGEISEGGKKIGSIYGAIGGGLVVSIDAGDKRTMWSVNMKDVFAAVQEAVENQYKR